MENYLCEDWLNFLIMRVFTSHIWLHLAKPGMNLALVNAHLLRLHSSPLVSSFACRKSISKCDVMWLIAWH